MLICTLAAQIITMMPTGQITAAVTQQFTFGPITPDFLFSPDLMAHGQQNVHSQFKLGQIGFFAILIYLFFLLYYFFLAKYIFVNYSWAIQTIIRKSSENHHQTRQERISRVSPQ